MTGCRFAALLARDRNRVFSVAFSHLVDAGDVSKIFNAGRNGKVPAIAIFSSIRTEAALCDQLARLAEDPRWRISEVRPEGIETDDLFVGVDWIIRDGLVSSTMGFGPFASMPVTRRAPYVCIAAWPGDHDNPHWTKFEPGVVHFLDTDLSEVELPKSKYTALTKASMEATKELLSEPPDAARFYRRAAFRLSPASRKLLRGVL